LQEPQTTPSRPELDERREYVSRGRQEEFIVPLLREAIEGAIAAAANAIDRVHVRKALDVGCGGQPFRSAIESSGFKYHAIDTQAQPGVHLDAVCAIDEPLPAALVQLARANDHGFQKSRAEVAGQATDGFDLILCTEVLEHVLDWPAAWNNLGRLLAPGGRLIITCPFIYPLHEEPYDFWRPTPHALRRFAERHDFRIIEQRMLGDGFDALGTVNAATTPDPAAAAGPTAKLLATFGRKARKTLHRILKSPRIRRSLQARSKLYLANFIVLTRDAEGGPAA
jgi:SAM-dependent methyltransferase